MNTLSRDTRDEYLTIAEAAEAADTSKDRMRRLCREKIMYGARKVKGKWWVPFAGLFPVLRRPEYAEARAEIIQLRRDFSVDDLVCACVLLTIIAGYVDLVSGFMGRGKSELDAKLLAHRQCEIPLYRIERLWSEYYRCGVRGLIEYAQACERAIGWPVLSAAADVTCAPLVGRTYQGDSQADQQVPLSIRWFMDCLNDCDDEEIDNIRKDLESSQTGRRIINSNRNRRLYAVLKPTREENLARIEYVLTGAGPFALFELLAGAKIIREYYEHDDYSTDS
ncbi:MAG: hypothetical protein KAY65_12640 [Planctomycetes bacterium]|nr:hypothetical protein [Planctomycetota bacterium]